MHIQSEITPPRQLEPSIPVSFEKIILKCTQKKPERRYASARELIADLRKVLTHPDGEYVVIPGAIPQGRTIVMNDDDIDSLKAASLRKNFGTKPEETYVEEPEEEEEEKCMISVRCARPGRDRNFGLGYRRFHYTGCDYFLYYRSCGRLLWRQRQSFWSQEQRYINGIYLNRIGF